jgi:CRP/FNR family transcriptional regulator, cyclic AMP receptor protein
MLIIERFRGVDGERQVKEAIANQSLVNGDALIADELTEAAELLGIEPGHVVIEQDEAKNDLYLILAGNVSVTVNGREVARRHHRQTVGEMALVDPASRRSATVIAMEETVVARIAEPDFARIGARHPELWRRIAVELADRLRQRNLLVRTRNEIPQLFIGSSAESAAVAHAIQAGLAHERIEIKVWTTDVFGPSQFPIESLEERARQDDFAALVLGPDDRVTSRSARYLAPRDNVVLELGLFIGAFGHDRVFVVVPDGMDLKIPSDLLGLTQLRYKPPAARLHVRRLAKVCQQLSQVITEKGPR